MSLFRKFFNEAELRQAVRSMIKMKGPGPDGVPAELVLSYPEVAQPVSDRRSVPQRIESVTVSIDQTR